MSSQAHAQHDEHHVDSAFLYVKVYGGLLVLTVFTVLVSTTFKLGDISHTLSLVVAMMIAAAKGSLVILFFMHVLHDEKLIGLIVIVSLFFMGLFFSMTMFDVSARGTGVFLEGGQEFRELNGIGVVNDLPDHHGEGHHGDEHAGGAHGDDGHAGEGHAEEAGHGDDAAHEDEPAGDEAH